MSAPRKSLYYRILLAVCLAVVATVVRNSLVLTFGVRSIFLLYHPAVFMAAWFGGFSCGVLAALLSVIAVEFFSLGPHISLSGEITDEIGNLGLFLVIGAFQSFLIDLFQRAVAAQREANEKLAEARSDLEDKVAKRTAELVAANKQLQIEVEEREEAEKQERFYANRSKALSLRLVELQEAEHRRIARELHDEIGQNLTGLKVVLGLAAKDVPPQVHDKFEEAQRLAQDLLDRIRQLSLDLRPLMLDDLGVLAALKWFFERYTRQTDIVVHFKHSPIPDRLPPEVETTIYRIVQEALANAARHSGARELTVRLWRDEETVRLQVDDNGRGFDVEKALTSNASTGLSGMQERAALLGGDLTIESAPGAGVKITTELPLTKIVPH